jgi:hypothetical protein
LERVLAFWERVAQLDAASESLRNDLLDLLFAHRAQGLREAAALLGRARRRYGYEIDAVSRYVLAELEEDLQRQVHARSTGGHVRPEHGSDTPN